MTPSNPSKPTVVYFKTAVRAHDAMQPYIDKLYPNRFQDARAICRVRIVEYVKGFAVQFGESGPYLTKDQL